MLEKKLQFRERSFDSENKASNLTWNNNLETNLETKFRFWKRNIDCENESSSLNWLNKLDLFIIFAVYLKLTTENMYM